MVYLHKKQEHVITHLPLTNKLLILEGLFPKGNIITSADKLNTHTVQSCLLKRGVRNNKWLFSLKSIWTTFFPNKMRDCSCTCTFCQQPEPVDITRARVANISQLHSSGASVFCAVLLFTKLELIRTLSIIATACVESLNYTYHLPSSFRDSLLNLNPLGSLPTK